MTRIILPVGYNDYSNTIYYRNFYVENCLPEIGIDERKGIEVLEIEEAYLDVYAGRYEEITQYDFYEIKSRILPADEEDADDDDIFYDYVAIPKEDDGEIEMEKTIKYEIYETRVELYKKEDLVQGCANEDCDPILITEFDTLEKAMEHLSENPTEVSMTIGQLGKPIYHATEYTVWKTVYDADGYPLNMKSIATSEMDLDWLE